jgi:magnesium-transporting ATPase (P-type)
MTIFIGPIVIVIVPLMQNLGTSGSAAPSSLGLLWAGLTFLFPASIMAMSLGNLVMGEEGQAVWRIYAAPFSPNSLVKSKYFFIVLFGLIIFAITSIIGAVIYQASFRVAFVGAFEAIFLVFALSAVSLANGIKGADFNELPRPRMIRVEWSLINLIACFLGGLAILGPLLPYAISTITWLVIGPTSESP